MEASGPKVFRARVLTAAPKAGIGNADRRGDGAPAMRRRSAALTAPDSTRDSDFTCAERHTRAFWRKSHMRRSPALEIADICRWVPGGRSLGPSQCVSDRPCIRGRTEVSLRASHTVGRWHDLRHSQDHHGRQLRCISQLGHSGRCSRIARDQATRRVRSHGPSRPVTTRLRPVHFSAQGSCCPASAGAVTRVGNSVIRTTQDPGTRCSAVPCRQTARTPPRIREGSHDLP